MSAIFHYQGRQLLRADCGNAGTVPGDEPREWQGLACQAGAYSGRFLELSL